MVARSRFPPDLASPTARSVDRLLACVLPAKVHQVVRFGIAGALSTGLYFVLVNAAVLGFGMDPVKASVGAYLLALAFSYAAQSRFTFRIWRDTPGQMLRFLLTAIAGLALSYWTMMFFTVMLDQPFVAGALTTCILIPLINFAVFKYWVFTRS